MKRWQLSRRTLLRGAGATMALPLLEQMISLPARGAPAAPPPRRFFAFYVPCGIYMDKWTPTAAGAGYPLPSILQPLAPYQADFSVLTGIANRPAQPDGAGDHASGTGAFLTAAHPFKTGGTDINNGISVDQVAAGQLAPFTRYASLELGIDGGGSVGDCDSGYSCAYARNISWAGPTSPLAKEVSPQALFDRVFGAINPGQTAEQLRKKKLYKQSVLDAVKSDAERLQTRLGRTDKRKVDEYLTAVRELEVRLQSTPPPQVCQPGARPVAPVDIRQHTLLMLDLSVLAFQCDLTRVVTFMLGNAGDDTVFNFLGLTNGHHTYSHHQGLQVNLDALEKIGIWEVQQFGYLLGKLKGIQEGTGTLLDTTAAFFSSEIEDGNSHAHTNMPVLLAGRSGGTLNPGRHITFPTEQSFGNLFRSILSAMSLNAPAIGNSTGMLSGL